MQRVPVAGENVDAGAGHSKIPASSCFSAQGKTLRGPVVENPRATWVLRLRATNPVSRDRSVRRSAQDDVFVGVLTKNI
jgi:hypothetical protein